MLSIEDIILGDDQRGVAALRTHLPKDFCDQAAQCVLDNPGVTVIVTGFYISMAGATETDGLPGALALGRALEALERASSLPQRPLHRPDIADLRPAGNFGNRLPHHR